jgi:hypothetical protein
LAPWRTKDRTGGTNLIIGWRSFQKPHAACLAGGGLIERRRTIENGISVLLNGSSL